MKYDCRKIIIFLCAAGMLLCIVIAYMFDTIQAKNEELDELYQVIGYDGYERRK